MQKHNNIQVIAGAFLISSGIVKASDSFIPDSVRKKIEVLEPIGKKLIDCNNDGRIDGNDLKW